jgi:AraC-like DNA-binding protein
MRTESNVPVRNASYLCRLRRDIARDLHAGDRVPALTREFNRTTRSGSSHSPAAVDSREMPQINGEALERDPRLRRVTDLVRDHYDEQLPAQRAARAANLETAYFSRYFHEKTGVTYLSWLNWFRVQQTIHMIEETHCTVTCAALTCGFSDVRTCQRAFLRHTGKTASEIKRHAHRHTKRNSGTGLFGVALPFIEWLGEFTEVCLPEIAQTASYFV